MGAPRKPNKKTGAQKSKEYRTKKSLVEQVPKWRRFFFLIIHKLAQAELESGCWLSKTEREGWEKVVRDTAWTMKGIARKSSKTNSGQRSKDYRTKKRLVERLPKWRQYFFLVMHQMARAELEGDWLNKTQREMLEEVVHETEWAMTTDIPPKYLGLGDPAEIFRFGRSLRNI